MRPAPIGLESRWEDAINWAPPPWNERTHEHQGAYVYPGNIMRIDEAFAAQLTPFDLEPLSVTHNVVYAVDQQWRLRAFNEAWEQFARDNGGARVLTDYPLRTSILGAMHPLLAQYYRERYGLAIRRGQPFENDFECSSDQIYRRFHQTAYPLSTGTGLLIVNHPCLIRPIESAGKPFSEDYIKSNGLIAQCCHCRMVYNNRHGRWDWVPELVATVRRDVSHTLCPPCLDYYYPDIDLGGKR